MNAHLPSPRMRSLSCSALIFDLDGVLVDSAAVVDRHWRRWARQVGLDPDVVLRAAHGRRTVEVVAELAPALVAGDEAARLEAAAGSDAEGLVVYDGAAELLRGLPPTVWAVATSAAGPTARSRLAAAGLPVPSVLISADDVRRGKPDPEPFVRAAEAMGYPPHQCVVVEDAEAGVEAALRGGMRVVAVTTTHSRDRLHRATAVASSVASIRVAVSDGGLDVSVSG